MTKNLSAPKFKLLENATMLMLLNIAKLVLPFVSLPYLTRVLTTDAYGTVAYIKSVIGYMQVIVDFGFMLSGTKDIVAYLGDRDKLNRTIGDILFARILVSVFAFLVLLALVFSIPILKENKLFALLSFLPVFLSVFLFDYVFRGLEKMHVITIRFFVMKSLSTILIFFVIKKDSDILKMPIIDTLSSLVAVVLVFIALKKEHIIPLITSVKAVFHKIYESFLYFISNVAAQSFNALNTIVAGVFLTKTDIAYWSVALQIIGAIQMFYSPISDAIYPEMLRSKRIVLIKKVLYIFQPIVFIGCLACFFLAELGMKIVGGNQYLEAAPVFRFLIPILFFAFPSIILGWPTLGAIQKIKEVTTSTVITIVLQILGLVLLIVFKQFTLFNLAVLRSAGEFTLFLIRFLYCIKFRNEFSREKVCEK